MAAVPFHNAKIFFVTAGNAREFFLRFRVHFRADECPMNGRYSRHPASPNIMEPKTQACAFLIRMHTASKRRRLMKTIAKLAFAGVLAAGAAVGAAAPAEAAHVSVGIGVVAPGYYGYYGPRYYGPRYCDPYYYDCGYYAPRYYAPGYVGFYYGGHRGWHGHRGYHGGWHHHR